MRGLPGESDCANVHPILFPSFCSVVVGSAIVDVVDESWSMHMEQGRQVSSDVFYRSKPISGDVVGFDGGVSDGTASERYKGDDSVGFVRDSMLLGVGCNSISAIVSEQFDVERSVAVVRVAEASECEPLTVGVFSANDF